MLDFKTRSASFPGIINFVQTPHLICVSGSCSIKEGPFSWGRGGSGWRAKGGAVWFNGFLTLTYSESTVSALQTCDWDSGTAARQGSSTTAFSPHAASELVVLKKATAPDSLPYLPSIPIPRMCGRTTNYWLAPGDSHGLPWHSSFFLNDHKLIGLGT